MEYLISLWLQPSSHTIHDRPVSSSLERQRERERPKSWKDYLVRWSAGRVHRHAHLVLSRLIDCLAWRLRHVTCSCHNVYFFGWESTKLVTHLLPLLLPSGRATFQLTMQRRGRIYTSAYLPIAHFRFYERSAESFWGSQESQNSVLS